MFSINKYYLIAVVLVVSLTACFNDLDTIPLDEDIVTSAQVYDDPNAYEQVLAKVYAGLAVSGQQGPAGDSDISGIDEGFGQYLRALWYHQELPTDEAVVGWNDQTIKDFHEQDWDANDNFINAFYSRIFYQISLSNEFIRETTTEKLSERGADAGLQAEVEVFRAEARFLRALSYFHALDNFRNVPFVTEEQAVGSFFPEQISGEDLFAYIESELKAIESTLVAPRQNVYGRADQAAAWALLARLYLNAEVYTGQAKYTECLEYCNKIIGAGYQLEPEYENLFLADNHTASGIIFPITFDGTSTRTWGGMTFIIRAGVGGDMIPADYGISGGWGGTRTTSALVNQFAPAANSTVKVTAPNFAAANFPQIYVPGEYQDWDPTAEGIELYSPNNDGVFEGYFNFERKTEVRFTPARNWNSFFGDDNEDGQLDSRGENIAIDSPGFYKIMVNINNFSYTIEPQSWGVIGSATFSGWEEDIDMTYDPVENALVLNTNLSVGEFKFRANDDWVYNLGDSDGDILLEQDGENIVITTAGTYTIKLYLGGPNITYALERPSADSRGLFFSEGQNLEIADIAQFQEGYAVVKFKNITSEGVAGSNLDFPDTDFPVFRLADVYLMYAEAVLRGGSGGDRGTALQYVNELRTRAYKDPSGGISADALTLDFLLEERGRELYWEATRRTDLVRFGQFSNGSYMWPWKGGVPEGKSVDPKFDLFPIPAADIGANPNLTQNVGY